jgi:biotin carboxylase
MKNIVYVAPFPMNATLKFGNALCKLPNVRVFMITQKPPIGSIVKKFEKIVTISSALSVKQIREAVIQIQNVYGPVHRLLGVLENIQEQLALVRQELNISGMKPQTAHKFRDKGAMKEALRAAGVPCAKYKYVNNFQEAWGFIDLVGFPIILKPPSGAGCRATYRVDNPQGLIDAINEIPMRPILAEEFLTGAEHSMESFTVNGIPQFSSFSRYYPSPLEVMQNPHLQWVVLFPKEIEEEKYKKARKIGFRAIQALGLQTGMTHMEWFCRPDGSIAVGEIGARPPGAQISETTGFIHGFSTHQTWAELMVYDRLNIPTKRKHAAAVAFLRGIGLGKVYKIEGLDEAQRKMGSLVCDVSMPKMGQPKSSTYEGEGWVIIKGQNTEEVKMAALELIRTVRIHYR